MLTRWVFLSCLLGAMGCATVPVQKDDAFSYAVEAVQGKSYAKGARASWSFVSSADEDDPRYDRGLRLLAQSAEGMELYWAAGMIYRQIAQSRRNMDLVPDALRGIERLVKSGTFDSELFVTSLVASEEFGDLPDDVQAFVDFYQGLDLARRGDDTWADDEFDQLEENTSYAGAAEYVKIVRLVALGEYEEAVARLEAIREDETLEPRVRQDVERTLARIAFEEQRYNDALAHFQTLQELAPDDPEILLETAWTYFYLGNSRKTLGLLVALDAPVHKTYIAPERFLLEALALRRLCQFQAAREAAVRLEAKYEKALEKLGRGVLPQDIPQIRAAARQRLHSRANTAYFDRLKQERRLVNEQERRIGKALHAYLLDLYDRGIAEATRREEEMIGEDVTALTEELLASREGVRLIVHELGVSLLRGRRRPAGAAEKPAVEVPVTGERVFYPFGGEYWTDELDDLVVIAEDRCID